MLDMDMFMYYDVVGFIPFETTNGISSQHVVFCPLHFFYLPS